MVMCELFAMSSLLPTSVSFSLERLARHGGAEGPHRDGWGMAFYSERDALVLREAQPASDSELIRYIERHSPPSRMVISHLRLATLGECKLANTQPFSRELTGRMHLFAHNGDLPDIERRPAETTPRFEPVGETDSERAFCRLMERMATLWMGNSETPPPLVSRLAILADQAAMLRELGPANFIYSDSHTLFVHADRRIDLDDDSELPGLFLLTRDCDEEMPDLTESGIRLPPMRQTLTLAASVPLTDEPWQALQRGTLLAIEDGRVVAETNV